MVIPLILGIATAIYVDFEIPFLWFFIFAFIGYAFYIHQRGIRFQEATYTFGILIVLSIYLIGYQICIEHQALRNNHHFSNYIQQQKVTFVAKVKEIPIHGKQTKFKATIQYIDSHAVNGNAILYLKPDSNSRQLNYGDIIVVNGYLNEVELPSNPYQFNYKRYLHFRNIYHQSFVYADNWKLASKNQGNPIYTQIFNLRKNGLSTLKYHLSDESYQIAAALVLGYREALTDKVQAAYADTGAIHVLAVSGLHVGIIAGILGFLMRVVFGRKFRKKKLSIIIVISGLWLFALLTGGSPSVLRAATMFTFVTYGYFLNRTNSIYNNLAISAFLLLIWNPYLLMAVGFQLSYLAVLGIVYFTPKLEKLIYIPNPRIKYFWTLICVAIGAQIGTLPVSLYYFHQFPLLFMLSGIVVIPCAAGILGLGLLTILLDAIHSTLALPFSWLLDSLIGLMNSAIFGIKAIPVNKIEGLNVNIWIMLLIFGVIYGLIYTIQQEKTKRGRGVLISLVCIALIAISSAFTTFQNHQNQKLVVYSIYQQTAIDLIDGRTSLLLVSDNFNQNAYDFNIKNHHIKLNIHQKKQYTLTDTIQTAQVFYNGRILYFNNKTTLMLTPDFDWQSVSNLKVDHIIVIGTPYLRIKKLVNHIDFQTIIFDSSNARKNIKFWKKDCEELGLNYADVLDGKAFIQNY
jgi:competence protein ComEC